MRQPIAASGSLSSSTATFWTGLFGPDGWTSTESFCTSIWRVAGTMRKLRVRCLTAPGGATAHVFALRKNGADSALTCTVSGAATTASDLVNSVTLAPGDTVSLQRDATGGSPATSIILWSMEFESDAAGESGYTVWGVAQLAVGQDVFNAMFSPDAGASSRTSLVAATGAITEYSASVTVAPGAGKSHDFVIVVDGVEQDGTGGTPDTRLSISDTATSATLTGFTLNLTPGQKVGYRSQETGGAATTRPKFGCKFVATVDGQSQFSINGAGAMNTGAASYAGTGPPTWRTTETDSTGPISGDFWIWGAQILIAGAPGAGKSWTVSLRKNEAPASPTPSIVRTGTTANLVMTDTDPDNAAGYVDGDTFSVESVPSGTPAGSALRGTFIASDTNPASGEEALTGVESVGAVGTVSKINEQEISGLTGTSAVGTVVQSASVPLVGATGTSALGTIPYVSVTDGGITKSLVGLALTASRGSVTPSRTIALTGVGGTSAAGSVSASVPGESAALVGVSAQGAVGTLGVQRTKGLVGVSATGNVGEAVPLPTLVGILQAGVVIGLELSRNGTTYRLSDGDNPLGTYHLYAGLMNVSPVILPSSDFMGNVEAARMQWKEADVTRRVRTWMGTDSLEGLGVRFWMEPLEDYRALRPPAVIFRGETTKAAPQQEMLVDWEAADITRAWLDQLVPKRTITEALAPTTGMNCHAEKMQLANYGKGQPIVIGASKRIHPLLFGLETVDGTLCYRWLVAQHACCNISKIERLDSVTTVVGASKAFAVIGSGTNGTVTVTDETVGESDKTIEVIVGSGAGVSMSVTVTGEAYVVTLGTNGAGAPDATKNTSHQIANEIMGRHGVDASYSGNGSTALTSAEAMQEFAGAADGSSTTENVVFEFILDDGIPMVELYVPGHERWLNTPELGTAKYRIIGGTWCSVFYTRVDSVYSDDAVSGEKPFIVTVDGADTTGDGYGTLREEYFLECYAWAMENFLLPGGDYQAGTYPTDGPEFGPPDVVPLLLANKGTFDNCRDNAAIRGFTYKMCGIIGADGERKPLRDIIGALNRNGGCNQYYEQVGSYCVNLPMPVVESEASLRSDYIFHQTHDIITLAPAQHLLNEQVTQLTYNWKRDYIKKAWTWPNNTLTDDDAPRIIKQTRDYEFLADEDTVENVTLHHLAMHSKPTRLIDVALGGHHATIIPCSPTAFTHDEWPGALNVRHLAYVRQVAVDPMNILATLSVVDMGQWSVPDDMNTTRYIPPPPTAECVDDGGGGGGGGGGSDCVDTELWSDDFESHDALSVSYTDISNCQTASGVGESASWGVEATGTASQQYHAEFTRAVAPAGREGSAEFTFDFHEAGFSAFGNLNIDVRNSNGTLIHCTIVGASNPRDLEIYNHRPPGGAGTPAATVVGVGNLGMFLTVKLCWTTSSLDEFDDLVADGSWRCYVNDVLEASQDNVLVGAGSFGAAAIAWTKVVFSPMGNGDNIVING